MKPIIPSGMNPKGHYFPAVVSNNLVFISGQLPIIPETGELVLGNAREHVEQCMKNIGRILDEVGLKFDSLVQCRIYISDMSNWDTINDVYKQFLKDHKCARVVVPTNELHYGAKCEIEAIAEIKKD